MCLAPHDIKSPLILGKRNADDRYQKFVIKKGSKDEYSHLRFDQHPQPYISRDPANTNRVIMAASDKSPKLPFAGDWIVYYFGKKARTAAKFRPIDKEFKIDWDSMKDHDALVAFQNVSNGYWLHSPADGKVDLVDWEAKNSALTLSPEEVVKIHRLLWQIEAVDHALNAGEMVMALVPVPPGLVIGYFMSQGMKPTKAAIEYARQMIAVATQVGALIA